MTTREQADGAVPRDWPTLFARPEAATFLLLVIALAVANLISPFFADPGFILESSTYYVEICLVALIVTVIIISGEIDLSPAAMMALSASLFGVALEAGLPAGAAILIALGAGLVMGLLNGWLVAGLHLPSIIVTIGTLTLFRGIAQILVGDRSIGNFPTWFAGIDFRTIGIMPLPVMIFVAATLLAGWLLSATIWGRQIYHIGTNATAALHAGIRVNRIKLALFAASGVISAVAGLMTASRLGSVRYDMATGAELQMVLIAMLGGTYIFGGRGSILGTFLAAWLLVIIATGMTVANVPINTQLTLLGLLLIVAIIGTNAIYRNDRGLVTFSRVHLRGARGVAALVTAAAAMVAALVLPSALRSDVATANQPIRITLIPKNTGNPYFDSITAGFTDACKTLRCEFTTLGPATGEATSQIPFVTAQVQRRVDVIAIAPNSPDALNAIFDQARRRGSIVVTVNSDMPGNQSHRDAAILPVDFAKVGPSQIELMGSLIGYEGEIAILSATTDAPDQNSWIVDMRKTLGTNPKYARMRLVAVVYGNDDPQKSTIETEALLSNYPNLRGIISPTTVGVAAAAQAVENARAAPRVQVTGLGTPNLMRRFVLNGTVRAFQLWSPYLEGVLAAHFTVGLETGRIRNVVGTTFSVPGVGVVRIGEAHVLHTQADLTVFDKSNIGNFHF